MVFFFYELWVKNRNTYYNFFLLEVIKLFITSVKFILPLQSYKEFLFLFYDFKILKPFFIVYNFEVVNLFFLMFKLIFFSNL